MIFACLIIAAMTAIVVIGTQVSARVQRVMVFSQVAILLLFVVVGVVRLATGDVPDRSIDPSFSSAGFFHRPAFEAVPADVVAGEGTVEPVGVSEAEADAGQVAPVHASDEDARKRSARR